MPSHREIPVQSLEAGAYLVHVVALLVPREK